jgi:carbonic anhydrase
MKKMEIANDIRKCQYGNFFNSKRFWVGDTTVKFSENTQGKAEPGMFFNSAYAKKYLGVKSGEFEVLQFHFHHMSEHTIEGTHYELELHIVHLTKGEKGPNGIFAAAMGIIFDTTKGATVDKETETAIDTFFDSMKLNEGKEKAAIGEIKLANMMKYADMNNRWAYKGSLTTPPCTKTVYFNVLRKVWPLKKRHLD